ncbi:MAG: GlsB/YeaQ/YmgE family stress response membrane protein [Thermoanaerobaculia bacterium]
MLDTFAIMGLGSWILIGLIAGAIGKFLLPGKDPGGCIITPLIGVVGALIGGFIATYMGYGGISGFDVRSLVIATLGSILLLMFLRLFKGEKKKN